MGGAAVAGFLVSLSLILAIGAQNAFVLRQGLRREHVGAVVLVCALSDAVLIVAGVAGFGALSARLPWLGEAMRLGGAAFLLVYGALRFRAALRGGAALVPAATAPAPLARVLGTVLLLTWANPHVYLDTLMLIGSISAQYAPYGAAFGAGAVAGFGGVLRGSGLWRAAACAGLRPARCLGRAGGRRGADDVGDCGRADRAGLKPDAASGHLGPMSAAPVPVASRPVEGILWMLASGLCFVAVNGIVRYLGTDLPAAQSAFLRFAWGVLFLLPTLGGVLRQGLPPGTGPLFLGRGVVHGFAVIFWFYAMARLPVAEVTAIGYLNPVIVTVGAVVFFGERLALRRILAIVVALLGALIVLRPGLREILPGHLAQLCAASLLCRVLPVRQAAECDGRGGGGGGDAVAGGDGGAGPLCLGGLGAGRLGATGLAGAGRGLCDGRRITA